jgi:archaellum component FlaF (FlaF/FlaG flagellin family)
MGFSHVVTAGIVIIPLMLIAMNIPEISNTILEINEAAVDVSELEDAILNTHFEILNLQTTGLNNRVFFDLSNTGTTKLWDYENFDVIIAYEGIVNSVATNVTEVLSYSDLIPSDDPILFDAVTSHTDTCLVILNPCTFSHTVTNSGSDRILILGISKQNNAALNTVTYGGEDLTELRADDVDGNTNAHTSLWYLVDPPTGSNTVFIGVGLLDTDIVVGAISFTGVNQTDPFDAVNGATGNSATASTTLTTTTNEAWLIDVVGTNGGTVSVGAGQLERWNDIQASVRGAGSTEFTSSPGTFSMSWTKSASSDWAITAAALRPANVACCVDVGNWAINNISDDYIDPGIINKDETAAVRAKTSYQIITNGDVHVTVAAENGVKYSSFVNAQ